MNAARASLRAHNEGLTKALIVEALMLPEPVLEKRILHWSCSLSLTVARTKIGFQVNPIPKCTMTEGDWMQGSTVD
jgi:hypothetical protein